MDRKKSRIFYGWILAVCCMTMCTATSFCSSGMTTNLAAIKGAFGFTGEQTSLIITIRSISALICTFFAGRYFDRLGIKKGTVLAMLSGMTAFIIFSFAGERLVMYYLAAILMGVTYAYGLMLPTSLLLKRWFNKSLGTALATASCGIGVVSIVFVPLLQNIIDKYGVKPAFLVQAGYLGFAAVLLGLLVVEYPKDMDLEIYGGEAFSAGRSQAAEKPRALAGKWAAALVIATVFVGMAAGPAVSYFTLNFTTAGLKAMDVAKAISMYGLVLMVSKLALGKVIDKIGILKATIIYSLVCSAALFCLFAAKFIPTVPWMYFGLILTGASAVIQTLGYPNWVSKLDTVNYSKSLSRCQLGYQLGALLGSYIPGVIADRTGYYGPAYLIFSMSMLASLIIVCIVFCRSSRSRTDRNIFISGGCGNE